MVQLFHYGVLGVYNQSVSNRYLKHSYAHESIIHNCQNREIVVSLPRLKNDKRILFNHRKEILPFATTWENFGEL